MIEEPGSRRYELAQINIARFRLPIADPMNPPFITNLDRVNALAEVQPGFLWRFVGSGNDALDVRAYADPNIAINMSVWASAETLTAFVYRCTAHLEIMRRRREWFDHMKFYMALWWVEAGHRPSIEEGKERIALLSSEGPTSRAFLFSSLFDLPDAS